MIKALEKELKVEMTTKDDIHLKGEPDLIIYRNFEKPYIYGLSKGLID